VSDPDRSGGAGGAKGGAAGEGEWGSGRPAADGNRTVDLHTHSTASDGSATPDELVRAARAAALSAVALTDHDTVGGIAAANAAGAAAGVRIVAGVELSAVHADRELHILGLHLSRLDDVDGWLRIFRDTRVTRAEQMVSRLNALGVPVTAEAVMREAGDGVVGRPHVARAMIAGGWVRDQREAFDRFLGSGRPAYLPKHRLAVGDAIDMIHQADGLAIFAHPAQEGTRARIEPLVRLGLDGLEARHPSHNAEDGARIGALAAHFGLVLSGGSDWHGAAEGPRTLGNQKVPWEWLEAQEREVGRKGGREGGGGETGEGRS
jgi:predicted metal-dependent phosphoesterase TrpH